jgi:protein-disulfide isomerase
MDTKTIFSHPASLPGSILLGSLIIATSILIGGGDRSTLANIAAAPIGTVTPTPQTTVKDYKALVTSTSAALGSEKAPVTIVEFSDFQCPYCRKFFNDAYQDIKKAYIDTGKVRLVFRHYPLSFHPAARPAALASQCAFDQGKFWEFHDLIFTEQEKQGQGTVSFGLPELKAWAQKLGMNTSTFNSCIDTSTHADIVDADMKVAASVGVTGTPTFVINGKIVVGAQPFSIFKDVIDAALK